MRLALAGLVLCVQLWAGLSPARAQQPIDRLIFHTEEFPPFHYVTLSGDRAGWVLMLLDGILRTAGATTRSVDVLIQPWARSFNIARTSPNHVVFSTGRTAQREPYFSWVGPYSKGELMIYGPSVLGRQVSFSFFKDRQIGAVRDDISHTAAIEQGFEANLVVRTYPSEVMELLRTNKVQFFTLSEKPAQYYIDSNGMTGDVMPVYSLGAVYSHFAVNINSDPDALAQFQNAYRAFKATEAFQDLLKANDPNMLADLFPADSIEAPVSQ